MANEIEMTLADTAPILRPGEHGEWVHYLQQLLDTIARSPTRALQHRQIAVNSAFDARTEEAVKAFQSFIPMPATGVVDRATWEALYRIAQGNEADQTRDGGLVTADATHAKLDVGEEVGRAGWRMVNLRCSILDLHKRPFPNSDFYVRFTAEDGATSDESGKTSDGVVHLTNIWVPNEGDFHLYIYSTQQGHNGFVGDVSGLTKMKCTGPHVSFEASQTHGDSVATTYGEAQGFGWMSSTSFQGGFDVVVASDSGTITSGHSTLDTYSSSEAVTITFPGNGFEVHQT